MKIYNQNTKGVWATIHYNPGNKYDYETEKQIGYIDIPFGSKTKEPLFYMYDINSDIMEGRNWDEL